jgi:hypothetical protein
VNARIPQQQGQPAMTRCFGLGGAGQQLATQRHRNGRLDNGVVHGFMAQQIAQQLRNTWAKAMPVEGVARCGCWHAHRATAVTRSRAESVRPAAGHTAGAGRPGVTSGKRESRGVRHVVACCTPLGCNVQHGALPRPGSADPPSTCQIRVRRPRNLASREGCSRGLCCEPT